MGVGRVRWGVLSTARINAKVLNGAGGSDRVQITAVASRDAPRAEAYAREHGIEQAYGSYEALLDDENVEAVYISLPNSMHVEWSIRALEAGKHVLCEKPLTRSPTQAEEAFDAAERSDRFLMEAFMFRHHPQTQTLKKLVESGAIGELRLVRSAFSFPLTELGNVRLRSDLDGGALMDVGCYCISASRLLAGEPEDADGQQVAARGVDVRFAGTLRFAGDVLAHFDCGFDLPNRSELEAVGSDGTLVVSDPWHCRTPGIELRRDGSSESIEVASADSYRVQLDNLSGAIRGDVEPLLGREDAVGQARALAALSEAAAR